MDERNADGWFLRGLAAGSRRAYREAYAAFSSVLEADPKRFDAALELAAVCLAMLRHGEAAAMLEEIAPSLESNPKLLFRAAEIYTRLGLHDQAWPLYLRADQLQPESSRVQASLAACAVLVGEIDHARSLYTRLLEKHPNHQRNHYELSRLGTAEDFEHVDRMKGILENSQAPPESNIFLYYAIGKELEDLGEWHEAYRYYEMGGNAAAKQARAAGYSVRSDIELIDSIIETCDRGWLESGRSSQAVGMSDKQPIFIVGLPRTGTTLTERILSSHSRIESADETFFLRIAIKKSSGVAGGDAVSPEVIRRAARRDSAEIARIYRDAVGYRLTDLPYFIDKYPENYLYLGFIARAFPAARIVQLRRNPMDACFAMYKQSYFRQAYTLEDLGDFYLAYDRLSRHWRDVLGDRLIEVDYESLVTEPEAQTRSLLGRLGLGFEPACLQFHRNKRPSATASNVQVRERVHTRSVNRWKCFEEQLQPLRDRLEAAGIVIA
ncbi:MAG: sulfotransferase [Planctomycetes bacterium]|nr:sulfotransferase [Planctomycetota bacterium]